MRENLHATALVAGRAGILVMGASGSGKSSLALAMADFGAAHGVFVRLVADDRVWLRKAGGRLLASVPQPIEGLVEVRGYGPAPMRHEAAAVIDLVVRLVDPLHAPRHRDDAPCRLLGLDLPSLVLASRDARGAVAAVAAHLGLPGGK